MGDWRTEAYGAVAVARRERALDEPTVRTLLSVTATEGVIDQLESGRRDISADNKSKYLVVRPGDVVYNTMRMWQGVSGHSSLKGIVSPAYTVVHPDKDALDARFLAHLMKLPENVNLYRRYSQGLVSDTWNLKFSALAELPLSVPPLEEQRRIAQILDTIDETIQATERVIAKLAASQIGLEQQMFRSEAGKWVSLQSVATVDRGKFSARPRNDPAFYGGDYPFIQTGDVTGARRGRGVGFSQALNSLGLDVSRSFPPGTIAVTIAANIAETAILTREMCFPDSVVGVVVEEPNDTRWVEMCIHAAKPMLEGQAPQSAQKNINLQDLRPLRILMPPPERQSVLASVWEAQTKRIRLERAGLEKRRSMRAGLAADLLSGRVRTVAA